MPLPTDFVHCISDLEPVETPLAYTDPFMALHFHFGMLLGVADFEAQQAYHRGKSRLHNAWLHGAGVVWGLRVTVDRGTNEVRVEPGLALDRAGHELYLDANACVDVGAWYDRHQKDSDVMAVVDDRTTDVRKLKAHVVARFRPCLTREVPALSEPCEGGTTDTAFSRVAETIQLELKAGDPPAAPRPEYERIRILLGLQVAREENGATVPEHEAVLKERARIAALTPAERPAATVAATRRFLTLDAMDRSPAADADGDRLLFPAPDDEAIVLATIDTIELRLQANAWTLMNSPAVHFERRDTLLPACELQYLLAAAPQAGVAPDGPRIAAWTIADDSTVVLTADRPVDAAIVKSSKPFAVASRLAGAAWSDHAVKATLGADGKTMTLKLTPALAPNALVRVIARGTGAQPLLGTDDAPLAGGTAGAGFVPQDGRDFVVMTKRS